MCYPVIFKCINTLNRFLHNNAKFGGLKQYMVSHTSIESQQSPASHHLNSGPSTGKTS